MANFYLKIYFRSPSDSHQTKTFVFVTTHYVTSPSHCLVFPGMPIIRLLQFRNYFSLNNCDKKNDRKVRFLKSNCFYSPYVFEKGVNLLCLGAIISPFCLSNTEGGLAKSRPKGRANSEPVVLRPVALRRGRP